MEFITFECYACKKCLTRKDNFLRHFKEVHVGILKLFDCGKKLTSTCFKRHQRNACPLRDIQKKQENLPTIKNISSNIAEITTFIKFNDNNTFESPAFVLNGVQYTIAPLNQIKNLDFVNLEKI